MNTTHDARQIEQVLSQLAQLKHRADAHDIDALDDLRPSWLSADAWDIVLEDLETQRYRERARPAQLRVVGR